MADGGGGGGDDGGMGAFGDEFLERLPRYILVDRVPVRCRKWAEYQAFYLDIEKRQVGCSIVGHFDVSTVFLCEDMNYGRSYAVRAGMLPGDEPPIFFETMTFVPDAESVTGETAHGAQSRCSTWLEAEAQHARAVSVAHRITYPDRYPPSGPPSSRSARSPRTSIGS
jgi:hypothetical protein